MLIARLRSTNRAGEETGSTELRAETPSSYGIRGIPNGYDPESEYRKWHGRQCPPRQMTGLGFRQEARMVKRSSTTVRAVS